MFSPQFLGGRHQNIFTVCWTRRRALLNWLTFRSYGASRLHDATVRSRAAIRGKFFASCIPEGAPDGKSAPPWQHIDAVHPKRAGIGKICAPCIRKALQIAFWECIARRSCQGAPPLHGPLESCTARESCHSWVFRLGVAGEVGEWDEATAPAAVVCRLPPKTWRCDGVSLNCHCSAVLF